MLFGNVVGTGSLAMELMFRGTAPGNLDVVCDWTDLSGFAASTHRPWLLVEGGPTPAIGPIFTDGAGCFECFRRRRAANGARSIEPVRVPTPELLDAVESWTKRWMEGDRSLLYSQRVPTRERQEVAHSFLPVPTCRVCKHELPKRVPDALLDSRLGVLHALQTIPRAPFTGASCWGADLTPIIGRKGYGDGAAFDLDVNRARARAMGEAVERYCAAFVGGETVVCMQKDLSGRFLAPADLGSNDPSTAVDAVRMWVRAQTLKDREPIWIPAAFVFLPYVPVVGEPHRFHQCSTGLAAGRSIEEALHHAVPEMVERDAFMRAWRYDLRIERLPDEWSVLEGIRLVRIPHDALEVVVAILESERPPLTAWGLAAAFDRRHATTSAVFEAFLQRVSLDEPLSALEYPPRSLREHARVHAFLPELAKSRSRWLDPTYEASPPRLHAWDRLVDKLPDAAFVDLTTRDIASVGMHVVRVVAPGLVRLDHDSTRPALEGNPTPHPLA